MESCHRTVMLIIFNTCMKCAQLGRRPTCTLLLHGIHIHGLTIDRLGKRLKAEINVRSCMS